jgi:hypothetical protein
MTPIERHFVNSYLPLRAFPELNYQRTRFQLRPNLQLESTPGTSSALQDRSELATPALHIPCVIGVFSALSGFRRTPRIVGIPYASIPQYIAPSAQIGHEKTSLLAYYAHAVIRQC